MGLFNWFFYSGSSWSDRDRQRARDQRMEARTRRRQIQNRHKAAKKRSSAGRGGRKNLGFGIYWE
jgi:hypothetical protein